MREKSAGKNSPCVLAHRFWAKQGRSKVFQGGAAEVYIPHVIAI